MFRQLSFVLIGLFFYNCESSSNNKFLYPSNTEAEVRLICSQAYFGPDARHQSWEKSAVSWLFISEEQIKVYFKNDRTRILPISLIQTLKPGKYPCPQ